jgi:hypothetical protein
MHLGPAGLPGQSVVVLPEHYSFRFCHIALRRHYPNDDDNSTHTKYELLVEMLWIFWVDHGGQLIAPMSRKEKVRRRQSGFRIHRSIDSIFPSHKVRIRYSVPRPAERNELPRKTRDNNPPAVVMTAGVLDAGARDFLATWCCSSVAWPLS